MNKRSFLKGLAMASAGLPLTAEAHPLTRLAGLAGCSPDELVITRNTTESLDMIIGGYPWQAGDEAIMALQDRRTASRIFNILFRR